MIATATITAFALVVCIYSIFVGPRTKFRAPQTLKNVADLKLVVKQVLWINEKQGFKQTKKWKCWQFDSSHKWWISILSYSAAFLSTINKSKQKIFLYIVLSSVSSSQITDWTCMGRFFGNFLESNNSKTSNSKRQHLTKFFKCSTNGQYECVSTRY